MTAVRLMLRRHRLMIISWSVLLIVLSAVTPSSYQSTYRTPAQRLTAVELARHNPATTLLYGRLSGSGTPASMYVWEVGAIAGVLVAIMAVLLAVALTRAAEDDGTLELLLSCGVGRRVPLLGAFAVLGIVAAGLTVGCTAGAGLATGRVDGVTWPGAVAFGSVTGMTFLVFGALTLVLAQVAGTARGAHVLGFAVFGIAFAVRAVADERNAGWPDWLSPLGLRATVRPFTGDRWWVLAIHVAVALALAGLAVLLSDRREYGAGLVPPREPGDTRLNIRTGFGLTARLSRRSVLAWTVAVACVGTLFSAMGSGVVRQSRSGDLGGFLGAQLGSGDPVAAYFAYSGTVVGMAVAAFAVLTVLQARHDEVTGLTGHALATGVRRWEPLVWNVAAAGAGSAVILVATGALSAVIAPPVIGGTHAAVRAFAYSAGQWPAAMACAGWTTLLIGVRPRWAWLAWAPVVAGGGLALLGRLLGVPRGVQRLGVFQHVPDLGAASPDLRALGLLLLVSGAACLLGVAGMARRDLAGG